MADEWFRSPAWDEAARAGFEARLARSRPYNRQQYLRVKAVSLRDGRNHAAAWELFQRVVNEPDGDLLEVVFARENLGDLAAERGDYNTAMEFYRRVLTEEPTLSGTTGDVEISLAELLLDSSLPADRDEARRLLDSWVARDILKFNSSLFRWHMALIRLAAMTGDRETVRSAAKTALELAQRGPQLSRHKDVGLVETDGATLTRLRKLAE